MSNRPVMSMAANKDHLIEMLHLHIDELEARCAGLESANKILRDALDEELINKIAFKGVLYGGDGFGLSLAHKQMEAVHKMMFKLSEAIAATDKPGESR